MGDRNRFESTTQPFDGGAIPWNEPPVSAIPDHIGEYRILGLLGQGGMGAVYEAEQQSPRRAVALKVIRPGSASPEALRRFEVESQTLARLTHPSIAQIYGAGTFRSPLGATMPYFAMELVRGEPLTRHAQRASLSTAARLRLLAQIARAVDHAHTRGVVHRDLKPGNILVTPEGLPKILDFGIARVADEQRPETIATRTGEIVGTLAYMAPEQVAGDPEAIDPRADVYALGVILYELLTGALPIDLSGRGIADAARAIAEIEPARLGTSRRDLRGDPETIAHKALEKDRSRRYPSAAELAADIERYLSNQPIVARPPSALYLISKFTRRNTGLVAGVSAAFVALCVGAGVAIDRAIAATRAEHAARDAELEANAQRGLAERRLAQSYVDAVNLAAQRGQWDEVLVNLDRAAQSGVRDDPGLLLRKAEALDALQRGEEATALVRDLLQRRDLGPHRGPALLWAADLQLLGVRTNPVPNTDSGDLLSAALEAGLGPADEAYARALLAEDFETLRMHARAAIAADPFHIRAHVLLGLGDLLTGRLDEAADRACALETISPRSPVPILLAATVAAFQGNADEVSALTERLGQRLSPAENAGAEALVRSVLNARQLLDDAVDGRLSTEQVTFKMVGISMALGNALPTMQAAGVRPPPMLGRLGQTVLPVLVRALTARGGSEIDALERLRPFRTGLESALDFIHIFDQIGKPLDSIAATDRLLADDAHWIRSLGWRGIVYETRLLALVLADFAGHTEVRDQYPDTMRQSLALWRPNHPGANPGMRATLWARAGQLSGLHGIAEEAIDRIRRLAPNDPEVARLHAVVAYDAGNYAIAVQRATDALRKHPDHPKIRELLIEAEARIGMVGAGSDAEPIEVAIPDLDDLLGRSFDREPDASDPPAPGPQ